MPAFYHLSPTNLFRMFLLSALLLAALASCGGANTATPEQTAIGFYKAYRANDNDQLKKLASRQINSVVETRCNGSLAACTVDAFQIPDGFDFTDAPTTRILEQTAGRTKVELEYVLASSVTKERQKRCQTDSIKLEEQQWLVDDFGKMSLCSSDVEATEVAEGATATAKAVAQQATDQAYRAMEQATTQAQLARQTLESINATATEAAKPTAIPDLFLTARQALVQSHVRQHARTWSSDAMLINVSFAGKASVDDTMIALDGTSRLWTFQFASKQLQKTIDYTVQDGFISSDTGNDAAEYKRIFAAKGEPFDIDLEHYLDSDQAATIAREHEAKTDSSSKFRMYLTINPDDELITQAPATWTVAVRVFLVNYVRMNGVTGEVVYNNFGPTGSPGQLPTPMAPFEGSSTPNQLASEATPTPTVSSNAPTVLPVSTTASAPLHPLRAWDGYHADTSKDDKGNTTTYVAANAIDGDPATAWRVPGDGKGSSVTILFANPVRLSEVQILPGYAKIDRASGVDRFSQNRRVQRVRLHMTGTSVEATLQDAPTLQPIKLDNVVTNFVEVEVLEATAPGTQDGRDFTPISEIVTLGAVCDASACGDIGALIKGAAEASAAPNQANTIAIAAIAGDFARGTSYPADNTIDLATLYLKREHNTWKVLTAGTGFDDASLDKLGIPRELWS